MFDVYSPKGFHLPDSRATTCRQRDHIFGHFLGGIHRYLSSPLSRLQRLRVRGKQNFWRIHLVLNKYIMSRSIIVTSE